MASPAPQILLLLDGQDELLGMIYGPLLSKIKAQFTTAEVDYTKAKDLFANGKPQVVLAVDGHLTRKKHKDLHRQLASYTKDGGAVVCCCNFGSFCRPPDLTQFFASFGLQWKSGDYHRTDFALNEAFKSVFGPARFLELEPSCSMKALHVDSVSFKDRVYGPTSTSQIQSMGFLVGSVNQSQSPAVYSRCGKGYLAYIGDVNNEESSQALIMVMISTFPFFWIEDRLTHCFTETILASPPEAGPSLTC